MFELNGVPFLCSLVYRMLQNLRECSTILACLRIWKNPRIVWLIQILYLKWLAQKTHYLTNETNFHDTIININKIEHVFFHSKKRQKGIGLEEQMKFPCPQKYKNKNHLPLTANNINYSLLCHSRDLCSMTIGTTQMPFSFYKRAKLGASVFVVTRYEPTEWLMCMCKLLFWVHRLN